ncbi:MAG: S8 family serine peptidase [Phycisphaerae bacterium]|nr:S8 family serine peptidase [Phycisphaerae bacterium]
MTLLRFQLGALAFTISALATSGAQGQFVDPIVSGEAMVRVQSANQLAQCLAALHANFPSAVVLDAIESRQTYLIGYELAAGQMPADVDAALLQLQAGGTIVWGELNYEGQASEGKTGSLWVTQVSVGASEFENQYAVPLLGLAQAHTRSTGFGVVVAVLDTGVDATHPLLSSSVLASGANFVTADIPGSDIGDGIDSDNDGLTDEMVGHGTFVAALIHLVAPDAKIMPVTVLNSDGIGTSFSVAKGVYWAIDHGADVINMSLGSTYHAIAVEEGVDEAQLAGIVVFGAAGNLNVELPREFPACDSGALGVAALDRFDIKAPFSNFNDKLDLAAPGHSELLRSAPTQFDATKSIISALPGVGYGVWSGTSFATAFVAATAALVRAQHPTWPDATTPAVAIVAAIENTLAGTSAPIDAINAPYKGMLGAGRIDAFAATLAGPIQPKPGDLNGDGVVGSADLGVLLGQWGLCSGACSADIDLDGNVDAADLAALLGSWG